MLAKGADISWLSQMEAEGIKFYYPNGTEGDCMAILKAQGMNCFRFRVWVNPTKQWNSMSDVVAKCRRAVKLGMDVMIDFHYSDSWADPGQQTIPEAWRSLSVDELIKAVGDHTRSVMQALAEAGVNPKWVQLGNEIGNGMLWPVGQADKNPAQCAALINAAYAAVKEVAPDAKTILHLQEAENSDLYKWFFDLMTKYGARYDVIGMSLYPEPSNYRAMVAATKRNMEACIARYDKDVMLCEVGMGSAYATECRAFITECLQLSQSIQNERFLGVLYWEPECYGGWEGYTKGAFTSDGRPSVALQAFGSGDSGIRPVQTFGRAAANN